MEFVDHRRNMEIIGEDQIIKGSGFIDGCFKDLRLGFASSNDVGENNESVDSAGSLFSDSSEIVDDDDEDVNASSSSCSSSSSLSSVSPPNPKGGPLYELSDLMAQLPVKRGLSKWYDGRSQSYTSLTSVRSLEDLMKKERPYNKRLKLCRSYEGDLDSKPSNKVSYSPKPTISKKKTKGSNRGFSFLSSLGKEKESPKTSTFSKLHTNSSSSLR